MLPTRSEAHLEWTSNTALPARVSEVQASSSTWSCLQQKPARCIPDQPMDGAFDATYIDNGQRVAVGLLQWRPDPMVVYGPETAPVSPGCPLTPTMFTNCTARSTAITFLRQPTDGARPKCATPSALAAGPSRKCYAPGPALPRILSMICNPLVGEGGYTPLPVHRHPRRTARCRHTLPPPAVITLPTACGSWRAGRRRARLTNYPRAGDPLRVRNPARRTSFPVSFQSAQRHAWCTLLEGPVSASGSSDAWWRIQTAERAARLSAWEGVMDERRVPANADSGGANDDTISRGVVHYAQYAFKLRQPHPFFPCPGSGEWEGLSPLAPPAGGARGPGIGVKGLS